MRSVAELMGAEKDADGIAHFVPNARGCPHCGAVEVKSYEPDGIVKAVFYHAGAECCFERLQQQVTWRQGELNKLRADLEHRRAQVDEYRRSSNDALSKQDAQRFAAMAAKAERNMETVEAAIGEKMKGIGEELSRLRRRRDELRSAA